MLLDTFVMNVAMLVVEFLMLLLVAPVARIGTGRPSRGG